MPRLTPDHRDKTPDQKTFLWMLLASGALYYGMSWWNSFVGR